MKKADTPTRKAFSRSMAEYGSKNREFLVIEADIGKSTYSYLFGEKYPERYFNIGIAEANAVTTAAGMASCKRTVVVCSYGVFLTMRALETVRTFVCYPELNVKLFGSHGGITAAVDGVTHQATEDIAFMTTLPNMKVLVPADPVAAEKIFPLFIETPGPMYARLMRDPLYEIYHSKDEFKVGGSHVLKEGEDITIISYGDMVFQALTAAENLRGEGINAEVIDAYSLKPLDKEEIIKSVFKTGSCLVVENHQKRNGLGYEIASLLLEYAGRNNGESLPKWSHLGLEDTFAESGDYKKLIDKYKISSETIVNTIIAMKKKA